MGSGKIIKNANRILELLAEGYYIRAHYRGTIWLVERARRYRMLEIPEKVYKKLVASGLLRIGMVTGKGTKVYHLLSEKSPYGPRSIAPIPCKGCGELILNPTQANQAYHQTEACLEIKKRQIALKRKKRLRERRELEPERPKEPLIKTRCLGPRNPTHFFYTSNPTIERICPLCRKVINVLSGGYDDSYGD